MGDVAKISFQIQSHSKHENLRSKQQPTIDKSAEAPHADRVPLSNENRAEKSARLKCHIVPDYRTRSIGTRPASAAESRPKGGCCNRRLSGLMGDVAKISFQTQSHSKHENLHSKQQPTIDKSAEAPHADRVPLSNENRAEKSARLKCHIVPDYRTRSIGTRPASAAESRPKGGCCNRRLSGLMGDVAKISFQTQSHSKHEYLHSKQHPTIDKSAEAQHAERVPLSAQKDE